MSRNNVDPEIQKIIHAYKYKTQNIQQAKTIIRITNKCFQHCVTKPGREDLTRAEKSCVQNCTKNFTDSYILVRNSLTSANSEE